MSQSTTEIGRALPAEWLDLTDEATGRRMRQFTSATANSYPLYYFVPSITADGKYMVFHSERTGWVQLYRLDLESGEILQLTEGRTRKSGWALFCESRLRGIYNHLSALNLAKSEVYYFQDEQVRSADIATGSNRLVHEIPGRISIGQTHFSPDGRLFAFIHADREKFDQALEDRYALSNMGMRMDGEKWRDLIDCTISLIDTQTGAMRDVISPGYHVHHVLFVDNQQLLVNHPRGEMGMWRVNIDGTGVEHLRPRNEHGCLCHQVITERGILYEVYNNRPEGHESWFGRYDLATHPYQEVLLPGVKFAHTGNDPRGEFLFCDSRGADHEILSIHFPADPKRFRLNRIRKLNPLPTPQGQRHHSHPFLGPDRKWIYFTEVVDGFSQIRAVEAQDLIEANEGWDA